MNFAGKTAVVTGGSRGIGKAVCLELARGGANVVLCYAGNAESAAKTVAECEALGAKALAVQCNVANAEEVKALMDTAISTFGAVHILVNNAGITRDGLLMTMKDADFDAVVDTNLKGAFYMTQQAYRAFVRQKGGRIVNISSVAGVCGNAGQANYACAKAGLIGLTKTTARELSGRNVTCNAIAPGLIETDMTAAMPEKARQALLATVPVRRMGTPEEVAALAVYLASDAAAYMTGQVLCLDGGMTM